MTGVFNTLKSEMSSTLSPEQRKDLYLKLFPKGTGARVWPDFKLRVGISPTTGSLAAMIVTDEKMEGLDYNELTHLAANMITFMVKKLRNDHVYVNNDFIDHLIYRLNCETQHRYDLPEEYAEVLASLKGFIKGYEPPAHGENYTHRKLR